MKRFTVPVQKNVVLTEGGTVTSTLDVTIPKNAAAVISYSLNVTANNSYVIAILSIFPGAANQQDIAVFAASSGTKSAVGLFPVDPSVDTIRSGISLSTILATAGGGAAQTSTVTAYVTFLVNEGESDQTPLGNAQPFQATPGSWVTGLGAWTSLAATAQTI